jgi:hypothetical protein
MKNKNKSRLLVFLQRTQMSIYKENGNKIETWTFDPALIADLEIMDEDKFRLAIDAFVNPLKLEGGEAIVLLDSSVYFTQKIDVETPKKGEETPNAEQEDEAPGLIEKVNLEQDEKLKFIHSMPFSNVFATILTIGKQKVIFGLNRDFYEPFIKEFTDRKYEVTYIYPMGVVNDLFGSAGFTAQTANSLIQYAEKYKVYSFLQAPIRKEIGLTPPSTIVPDPSERKRLYLLIGAFVLLLLLLGGVIWWSSKQNAVVPAVSPAPATTETAPAPTSSPAPAPTAEPIEAVEPLLSEYVVVIRNGSGADQDGKALQERLTEIGFTTTSVEEVSPQTSDETLIVVKPTVSDTAKLALQNELTNLGYSVSFQESQEVVVDITINISSN